MKTNLIVVDDFYNNPVEVRDFALGCEYKVTGNFPGRRTDPHIYDSTKSTIQDLMKPHGGPITWWGDQFTGAFQYTTALDRSWIHSDASTSWAGVLYLTPDAPLTAGTGLFRHKSTGLSEWDDALHTPQENQDNLANSETQDYTKWELVDRIGNKFNRLILYRAKQYHVSLDYFGSNINNGRLFQTFFFTTTF